MCFIHDNTRIPIKVWLIQRLSQQYSICHVLDDGVGANDLEADVNIEQTALFLHNQPRVEAAYHDWAAAVRRITVLLAVINVFYFAATSLLVLYTQQRLHAGSAVYSAMFVSAGLGTILTRAYLGTLVRRLGEIRAMALSFWFWTVPIITLAFTTTAWVAVSSYFLLGTGTGL